MLAGRVAFITGGGQGIGYGIAAALAREGADICLAELDPERGKRAVESLLAMGVRALAVATDASQRDQIENAVATAVSELGRLDILVNNATGAGGDSFRPLLEQTSEQ